MKLAGCFEVRRRSLDWSGILGASPAVLIAFVCSAMPLLWMVGAVCLYPEVRGELRMTDIRVQLLERTIGYNGIAAIIATLMGLPAGFVLGRGRGWLARVLWVVLPAALLMPSLSYAYGWAQFVRLLQGGLYDGSDWILRTAYSLKPDWMAIVIWWMLVAAWAAAMVAGLKVAWRLGWLMRGVCILLPTVCLLAIFQWTRLGQPTGWVVARLLLGLFGWAYTDQHIRLPMRPAGYLDTFRCIWSLAAWLWAVPAGLIGLALRRMDSDVQQQAILDGVLYRITIRQLLGPIIASMAVVTVLATQEFAVYEPTGISVVATEVRMVFDTGFMSSTTNSISGTISQGAGKNLLSPNQAARAAAAVATTIPLLVCTIALAIAAIWGAGKTSAADSLTVGPWPKILDAPWWAAAVTLLLVALNIGLPVWALVQSLHVKFSLVRMWAEFGPLVQGAIIVACMATAVCAVLAFSSATRWTPGLMAIGGASFLIGGQLLAIALIRIYNRELFPGVTDWLGKLAGHMMSPDHTRAFTQGIKAPFTLSDWAYDAFPVPVMAYVGRFGWLALAGARGTWTRPWKELRDMASLDGAGVARTARSVVWPLSWPTLIAGAMLVGALSLTEVPATVLLFPANPQVLTPTLMTWVHMARYDPMIEASLLMMMTVLTPALAAVTLVGIGLRMSALRVGKT